MHKLEWTAIEALFLHVHFSYFWLHLKIRKQFLFNLLTNVYGYYSGYLSLHRQYTSLMRISREDLYAV